MNKSEYRKVFIATGWDHYTQQQFVIIGKSSNSDAIKKFSPKQIETFHLSIRFSKNFFGEYAESFANDLIDDIVNSLQWYYAIVPRCSLFEKYGFVYYMDIDNTKKLLEYWYSYLTNEEKQQKREKRNNL